MLQVRPSTLLLLLYAVISALRVDITFFSIYALMGKSLLGSGLLLAVSSLTRLETPEKVSHLENDNDYGVRHVLLCECEER
jgi:hypothetical protein